MCAGVSAAVFAPGWVLEAAEGRPWRPRDDRLWDLIAAARGRPPHACLRSLPFRSCFHEGAAPLLFCQVASPS